MHGVCEVFCRSALRMRRDSGAAAELLPPMSCLRGCYDDERVQRERRTARRLWQLCSALRWVDLRQRRRPMADALPV